jgi:hypothetical protein
MLDVGSGSGGNGFYKLSRLAPGASGFSGNGRGLIVGSC